MKRSSAAIALVLLLTTLATAVLAQAKDPFQPATGVSAPAGATQPPAAPGGPAVQPPPASGGGGLVRTGADVELQVQAAAFLLIMGAAMLVAARARDV